MNVQLYKNIIYPLLSETFEEREAANIFKITLEDFFNKRYFEIRHFILEAEEIEELNYIFEKICNQYPIQYIFNKAHFYGLEFYVDNNVLIPRPETEELVQLILSQNQQAVLNVLDIGTGSGCIPVALKKNRPTWNLMAIDISEKALEVAQINAAKNQTNIDFLQYDILSSADDFNAKQLDIMVSNPPYIPLSQKNVMSVSTIEHEPEIALFVPNEQPLLFYDKITDFAARHLKPNGKLYFELNEFNAEKVVEMLQQKHYINTTLHQDLSRKNRMLSAERPPSI
ncbi:MAG: peptide chain release factor N(5)-glutamine methyltransferase [Chitinophagales bacterium]